MNEIRVWAPYAKVIQLVTPGDSFAMEKADKGWWTFSSAQIRNGMEYMFSINGKEPLPDPRSLWQPHGVHGYSRYLDHSLFSWKDRQWQPRELESAIIYELHTGTFSENGNFEGILGHLDHLKDLGITHIELMPVNSFSGNRGWGYDGVYLFAPMESYGGPDGLKRLVDECHRRGFSMIQDVVYNHLGPEGNYLGNYGPYFTDRYSTPWGSAINFDGPESDEVRRFFIENARMWLEDYHFDALRIDAVHAIFDMSARHFLDELTKEADRISHISGKKKYIIAESDLNDPRITDSRERGGYEVHAQWADDLHHAVHAFLTGERQGYYSDFGGLEDIAKALKQGIVYDGRYSIYRRKRHGKPFPDLRDRKLVGFIQNHDQVGNRARGERLNHLVVPALFRCAAALYLLSPFIPMIFQGEEWGASSPFQYFTSHEDPELGKAVTTGRRREFLSFGWKEDEIPDPQDLNTFLHSRLNWKDLSRESHAEILDWYRKLIALRKSCPGMTRSTFEDVDVQSNEEAAWILYRRGTVVMLFNLHKERDLAYHLNKPFPELMLSSDDDVKLTREGIILSPLSLVVMKLHV